MRDLRRALSAVAISIPLLGVLAHSKQGTPPADDTARRTQATATGEAVSEARERLNLERQKFEAEAAAERERLQVERDRVQVEKDKNELQKKQVEVEERKVWWTAVATAAPFAGVLLTIFVSVWTFRRQSAQQAEQWRSDARQRDKQQADAARLQFDLKAAEIAFAGKTPEAVRNRVMVLRELFGERVGPDFIGTFDPAKFGQKEEEDEPKRLFLELYLRHPDRLPELLRLWKQLFRGDVDWLMRVDLRPTQPAAETPAEESPGVPGRPEAAVSEAEPKPKPAVDDTLGPTPPEGEGGNDGS